MLLNIDKITPTLLNMLTYIGLRVPSSTSNLLIAQVWNASDTSGGKEIDERKTMVILFFFFFNLFFLILIFYFYFFSILFLFFLYLFIFYLFYNFFKTIGIVMKILGSSDDANDPNKNGRIVDGIKNSLGKDDDNDMRSEEKKLNNVNYSNDYNNNSNDNDNDNNNNNVENDDNYNGEE